MTYTYYTCQAHFSKDVEYVQEYECLEKKDKEWLNQLRDSVGSQSLIYSMSR